MVIMIGAYPASKEHFMKLSSLGQVMIEITPRADDPEIMKIDIGCQNRIETVSAETKKDETIDQFCQRLRGMMRAMLQTEVREVVVPQVKDEKKAETWEEQKLAIQGKKK